MGFFGDADIESMLSGVGGVEVSHAGNTGSGAMDSYDQEILQGEDMALIGRVVAVLVRTSTFPSLNIGDSITVNSMPCKINNAMAVDDGALTRIMCMKV